MGFEDLKSKLGAKEGEGYPVNDDTIKEWIEMAPEQKKELIKEAKEKGGAWRTSLLEIDQKAKDVLQEKIVGPGEKDPTGYKPPESDAKIAFDKTIHGAKKYAKENPEVVGGGGAAALAAGLGAVALAKKMRAAKKAKAAK